MAEMASIQWFPGHMTKTRRMIQSSLSLVDGVVEVLDARIPFSSRNPEMDKLVKDKPRMLLLNKSDMADDSSTEKWIDYYKSKGFTVLKTDCKSGNGLKGFLPAVKGNMLKQLIEKRRGKGIEGAPIRLMIVGIPNVGKSSFINRMAKSKKAKVEDRPGVTRNKQWIKFGGNVELLDMPGVLWPKFEDQGVARKLAFTGAVKDDILDIEALAAFLLENLSVNYPEAVSERYKIDKSGDGFELLSELGRKRGMLVSGGEVNTERAAITLLDEFLSFREKKMISQLWEYDEAVRNSTGNFFCGVDEAGRGPLAGDVYAAAVVLDPDRPIEGLNDSKKLSAKKRELLYEEIIDKSLDYCIARATVEEIEEINILNASMLAMRRAVFGLRDLPELVIADGNKAPDLPCRVSALVKGDANSASIAAASILAKVTRDRYMLEMVEKYPQFGFERHKGYGTKLHIERILAYGPCPLHRMSFLRKIYEKK